MTDSARPSPFARHARRPAGPGCVPDPQAVRPVRQLGEQALSRAAGAPLILGNKVRILENAAGNFPEWLQAIRSAQRVVYLENYRIDDDELGRTFAEVLAERAHAGVRVRVIYDWLGSFATPKAFWRHLTIAGVEVRGFNPFQPSSPFGWLSRDHRKMLAVDGEVAFVTGLCISRRWQGDPRRGVPPWRDTGVEIRGPAVADVERAFAQLWDSMGEAIPAEELLAPEQAPVAGDVALRVLAGTPSTAGLFRLDQLVAAVARRSLWLSDAYFVGVTPYVQALRSAARDGVDVRLLLPNATDLPLVRTLSRAGYRQLLEAGVRIFEWNGSMMHAKTAVVDGRWCRIGSSNLNLASFLGNFELDVAIDDVNVGREMERMFLRDLENASEIELEARRGGHRGLARASAPPPLGARRTSPRRGRSGAATAGAMRVANAVGAAVANRRVLEPAERRMLLVSGLALVTLAVAATLWPRAVALPIAVLGLWVGVALVWRASRLGRQQQKP